MRVVYEIRILDTSLNEVAQVVNPYPIDQAGNILRFSKELSDYGQCTFRISAFDDILTQYGDIIQPHHNHIRIVRNGTTVWQGAIIDNDKRNSKFIQVVAAEYEFYLSKILIKRSSTNPVTAASDGVFRIFSSGTMATAVTNIINETITRLNTTTNANSVLAGMTLGTVENPNFPPNMTDNTGAALTGAWTFSTTLQLSYDYQSVLYVLKSFGIYSYADFYLDQSLVFNFKKFVGNNRHFDVNFTFNQVDKQSQSNIIDYQLPRLGQRMANQLWGIATDTNGLILNDPESDQASITRYGFMEDVAAYADVKDKGILKARTAAELPIISTPDETNVIVILNETAAYPLGLWDIGDIVNIEIHNKGVDFVDTRRIVGATVSVHNTGREITTVQTNVPRPWQYGNSGGS